jgi:uncharacterized protein YqeY
VLIDEIKQRMTRAMRDKDAVAKNILGLALGEIQTAEARANRPLSDDEAAAVVRKLVKSNEETLHLAATEDPGVVGAAGADLPLRSAALRREIEVLAALLPKALSLDAVTSELAAAAGVADAIRAAKSDGQAMGAAMKHFKATGAAVDAESVRQAVQKLRA